MRRLHSTIALFAAALMMISCGGSSDGTNGGAQKITSGPSWYNSREFKDGDEYLYEYVLVESTRQQVAEQKARGNAATQMAQKLGQKVEALQKMFTEEITSGSETNFSEAFTQASKTIASQQISGLETHKIEFYQKDDGTFQCYLVARMPVGDARKRIENALSRDEELYVKFKESKAFEEMKGDLARIGN